MFRKVLAKVIQIDCQKVSVSKNDWIDFVHQDLTGKFWTYAELLDWKLFFFSISSLNQNPDLSK